MPDTLCATLREVLNPWTLGALTIWALSTILGWALGWLDRQTAPLERLERAERRK